MGLGKSISKGLSKLGSNIQRLGPISAMIPGVGEYLGAQEQNAANQAIAREQMAFQERSNREKMAFEQASAREQMAFQRESAQTAMNFEERMSSTAYQRAASDMEKAGLNRILAADGGASTPSAPSPGGAMASGASSEGASYQAQNVARGVSERIVGSALDLRRVVKEIKEADSRINLNNEQSATQKSLRALQDAQKDATAATAKKVKASTTPIENKSEVEKKHPKFFGWTDAIVNRLKGLIPFTASVHKEIE